MGSMEEFIPSFSWRRMISIGVTAGERSGVKKIYS
jgi:hypothetical protein